MRPNESVTSYINMLATSLLGPHIDARDFLPKKMNGSKLLVLVIRPTVQGHHQANPEVDRLQSVVCQFFRGIIGEAM